VALRRNFSGLVTATDSVKNSKDSATRSKAQKTRQVCTWKKFFGWEVRIFCEWCHK